MTQQASPFATYNPTPPKQKWWQKKWAGPVLLAVGCLAVGGSIGASGQPEPVEVVKEVPGPERVVTKTERVEVPVTPEACLTALTLNEEAFSGLAKSMEFVMDGDYAGASANTDKVSLLVPKVNAAKTECRAAK